MDNYDAIIIGSGPGGLSVAINLANAGKKILLIEKDSIGGQCTWSSCIPSKELIYLTKNYNKKTIFSEIKKLTKMTYQLKNTELLKEIGINIIYGIASFIDSHIITVNDKEYHGKNIIIATGSNPFIPSIIGLDQIEYLTNQNFFLLDKVPDSIVFIGAGMISLELSLPLAELGTQVILLEKEHTILPHEDPIIQEKITHIIKEKNIILLTNIKDIVISNKKEKYHLSYIHNNIESSINTDSIFISTGCIANIKPLNLNKVNIEYTKHGISINKYMQTNISHIYALGDVTGLFPFSYTAEKEAAIISQNILFPLKKQAYYLKSLPWVIYTSPEYARCGLNSKEVLARYPTAQIYELHYEDFERSIISLDKYFYLKIVIYKDKIISACCLSERAGEIIALIQIMIENNISFSSLAKNTLPYPGYINGIQKLAKESLEKQSSGRMFKNILGQIYHK